jgi:folate-binding protein YgfZ
MLSVYKFPNPVIIKVSGKDSTRYLNARLSNDLKKLANNNHIKAACLTANGRTLGYFEVFKNNEDYILFCTGGDKQNLINAVRQFVVADRVTVTELENYTFFHLAGVLSEIENLISINISNSFQSFDNNCFLLRNNRLGNTGFDLLVPNDSQLYPKLMESKNLNEERFNFLRISHGTLSFPEELNEENLFAESGLKEAVAFNKGCYVGQEVIEMIDARGTLPYIIKQFELNSIEDIKSEEDVYEDAEQTKKIGTIISVAKDLPQNKTIGFLRIKNKNESSSGAYINGKRINF